MKKYGNVIKYAAFSLAALLLTLAAVWAVNGDILGFVSKNAVARDEFEYETDDKILEDLLNEGDVSAIQQNEYEIYISSLPEFEGEAVSAFVPNETLVAVDAEYDDFGQISNTKMPAPQQEYSIPAGYSCTGAENGVLLLNRGGKYGYYLETGRWLTQPEYTEAYAFCGGIAVVKKGGRYGAVDTEGNLVIPAVFDEISDMDGTGMTVYKRGSGYTRIVFVKSE